MIESWCSCFCIILFLTLISRVILLINFTWKEDVPISLFQDIIIIIIIIIMGEI